MSCVTLRCIPSHCVGAGPDLRLQEKHTGILRQQFLHGSPQPTVKWRPLRKVCCQSPHHFVNRKTELAGLDELIMKSATTLTVLLGPRDSGKSTLLNKYFERGKKDKLLVTRIDCRALDAKSPESFARAFCVNMRGQEGLEEDLLQKFRNLGEAFSVQVGSSDAKVTFKATEVWDAFMGTGSSRPLSPIGQIKEAWLKLVEKVKPDVAVIFVDEANVLANWDEKDEKELVDLLAFCVLLTKQLKLGHVLLATSEDFFLLWLEKKIGPTFFESVVIGDMSEADARTLFNLHSRSGEIADGDWAKISNVCGYNPGLLIKCAGHRKAAEGDWDAVLEAMWKGPRTSVVNGLKPSATAGFTAQQYAQVACSLLDAPCCAVRVSVVEAGLGGGTEGADILAAMVKANLLADRPYSDLAKDIPKHIFGPDLEPVVTAPTAVHLFCMKRMRELFKRHQEQVVQQEPLGQPASSSSAVQEEEAEIKAVEADIKKVEAQIEECMQEQAEVKKARGRGWQKELEFLRQREVQLRKNLEQLRKNLEQLREQLLLLLRGTVQ